MRALVVDPVCDLTSRPERIPQRDFSHQKGRLTQLLFNEPLHILVKGDQWSYVETLDQPKAQGGYQGFLPTASFKEVDLFPKRSYVTDNIFSRDYSFGTLHSAPIGSCRQLQKNFSTELLVKDAMLFLDMPYLWGGCASKSKAPSSVDCSGFIHLLFRAQGRKIPRDAHDQFLICKPIDEHDLQVGDLLFYRKEGSQMMTHVRLWIGNGQMIEAPSTGKSVGISDQLEKTEHVRVAARLENRGEFIGNTA